MREIFLRLQEGRIGVDRENIFPDITELFSREGGPLDADRIFSKELIIGKVTPSWLGGSTAMELQSNGPPWKMVLIVDSHGNDWNRVDQKFSIEPPIPSSTRSVESLALTTGKLLNRITETVLARCPSHRHSLTRNLPRDPRQRPRISTTSFVFFNSPPGMPERPTIYDRWNHKNYENS